MYKQNFNFKLTKKREQVKSQTETKIFHSQMF